MYLNKATIIGNLTRDIELTALPSGVNVAKFGVATNRNWKDKDGNRQEEVEFHNVVAFGKQAEVLNQYMKKGSQILVEGRLKTSNWDDKDSGKKMYRTEIILENFQFGNKAQSDVKQQQSAEELANDLKDTGAEALKKKIAEQGGSVDYPEDSINPDLIPF